MPLIISKLFGALFEQSLTISEFSSEYQEQVTQKLLEFSAQLLACFIILIIQFFGELQELLRFCCV